jgi:4-nitrophenyl phosphatase
LLFTNNSTLTPDQYVEKLATMGIHVKREQIFTSAQATALYLPQILEPGAPVYMIGEDGLRAALVEAGYELVEDRAVEAVVVGMDTHVTYAQLRLATLAIRGGALFVGTNPDVTFPAEDGIVPGNGAILAALETATEQAPLIIGKPEKPIFDIALKRLDACPDTTVMIGDRPETDILGAKQASLKTIFVLSGVADEQDLQTWNLIPDWTYEDVSALHASWLAQLS